MMEKDPRKRLTIKELLEKPLFKSFISDSLPSHVMASLIEVMPPAVEKPKPTLPILSEEEAKIFEPDLYCLHSKIW